MSRRPGLTLTEVLVTLAILAFGILAILTLFPLAASQMAIAVREDRSAQAANAADGYIRAYWKSEVAEKYPAVTEPFYTALDDPDGAGSLPAATSGPSYPVVIDPMGRVARSAPNNDWMGDGASSKLARRGLGLVTSAQHAFRVCSLMDGLGYDENGHPTTDRELRYNWAWLVQCPDVTDKKVANLSVIVYDNRPNLYAPTGSEAVYSTVLSPIPIPVVPGSTQVQLVGTVNVKPGGWILDVTDPTVNPTPPNNIRHAIPYQVVSVAPSGPNTVLELQTPIQKSNDTTNFPGAYRAQFVVMRGVTGIYPRTRALDGN